MWVLTSTLNGAKFVPAATAKARNLLLMLPSIQSMLLILGELLFWMSHIRSFCWENEIQSYRCLYGNIPAGKGSDNDWVQSVGFWKLTMQKAEVDPTRDECNRAYAQSRRWYFNEYSLIWHSPRHWLEIQLIQPHNISMDCQRHYIVITPKSVKSLVLSLPRSNPYTDTYKY